jgi:site-specific DNA-methyltransferase (adenine-specific)
MIELHNIDCMEYLATLEDNAFELAIVDPPYGLDVANMNMGAGIAPNCSKLKNRSWTRKNWDKVKPTQVYFNELFRVSQRQVIWGGNYFQLPISQYFAIWDKGNELRGRSFAEGEYAWVSEGGTRIVQISPINKDRIHPTQKPVRLYEWLLMNYAKEGDRILDTHLGSGSIAIACHNLGFDLVGCELDTDYFNAAQKRLKLHQSQLRIPMH